MRNTQGLEIGPETQEKLWTPPLTMDRVSSPIECGNFIQDLKLICGPLLRREDRSRSALSALLLAFPFVFCIHPVLRWVTALPASAFISTIRSLADLRLAVRS
jgi:hypothetical protein